MEKNELREASKFLLSIKRSLRLQREGFHKSDKVTAHNLYPPATQVPTDADGFVVSFHKDILDDEISKREVVKFFDLYGFVVFRDVLTPEDCEGTASEIVTGPGGEILDIPIDTTGDPYKELPFVLISGNGFSAGAVPLSDENGYITEFSALES